MALPVPIIMSLMPVLSEIACSEHKTNTRMREIEAQENIELMKYELKKLEVEADIQKVNAQKEILQSLINAATHVFDKKIDAFRESFLHSHALIEEHQKFLLEEQREIKDKLWDNLPDSQFFSLNNRLSEISGTLIDLKKVSSLMVQEFNQRIFDTNIDMDSSKCMLSNNKTQGLINE